MKVAKTGRNEPCPCGSGRKYKQCCAGKADAKSVFVTKWVAVLIGGLILVGVISFVTALSTRDATGDPGQIWSPEHGHYHD